MRVLVIGYNGLGLEPNGPNSGSCGVACYFSEKELINRFLAFVKEPVFLFRIFQIRHIENEQKYRIQEKLLPEIYFGYARTTEYAE